MVDQVSDHV